MNRHELAAAALERWGALSVVLRYGVVNGLELHAPTLTKYELPITTPAEVLAELAEETRAYETASDALRGMGVVGWRNISPLFQDVVLAWLFAQAKDAEDGVNLRRARQQGLLRLRDRILDEVNARYTAVELLRAHREPVEDEP